MNDKKLPLLILQLTCIISLSSAGYCSYEPLPRVYGGPGGDIFYTQLDANEASSRLAIVGYTNNLALTDPNASAGSTYPLVIMYSTQTYKITWNKYLDMNGGVPKDVRFNPDGSKLALYVFVTSGDCKFKHLTF
jgi:hypothetical protein